MKAYQLFELRTWEADGTPERGGKYSTSPYRGMRLH